MAKSPVHVVYLSYDGLTDPLGQSQIMPYIGGLKEYRFTVISFEKKERYGTHGSEIQSWCNSNFVKWVPLTYHKWPPVLSTVYDLIVLWFAVRRLYREEEFKVVHCRSYITSLVGLRSQKKWGVKFIFDMRGFWADERVEGKVWNLKNPLFALVYNYFKRKEKQFLLAADHVVSLTQSAKAEIRNWEIETPITVIPTCVDMDTFNPEKINKDLQRETRIRLGIRESDLVLIYLGSWGTWYLTDEMRHYFQLLRKQKNGRVKWLIVTQDSVSINDPNVIIKKAQHKDVPILISLAHVAVMFIKPTFSKKASSATKLGEILAMNVPVVTNRQWGDVDSLLDRSFVSFASSDEAVLPAVLAPDMGQEPRDWVKKNLSLSMGVERYRSVYEALLV